MERKIKNKPLKITENQFGVLLENMDSKIDLVLDGHSALNAKIDKNHEEFEEFREETNFKFNLVFKRFDDIDKRFEGVDKRFEGVDKRFEGVDKRFEDIDKNFKIVFEYLSKIDDELQFVKAEVLTIKSELKKKADISRIKTLEERITKLEKSNMEIRMMITQKV